MNHMMHLILIQIYFYSLCTFVFAFWIMLQQQTPFRQIIVVLCMSIELTCMYLYVLLQEVQQEF